MTERGKKYSGSFWDDLYRVPYDATIRRYRPFDYFESILRNGQLWFGRADTFPDDFEGTLTRLNRMYIDSLGETEGLEGVGGLNNGLVDRAKRVRYQTYLNCWRLGTDESAVLWNAYLQGEEGVAIETTVEKLVQQVNEDRDFHLWGDTNKLKIDNNKRVIKWGRIRYIDYVNQWISEPVFNNLSPYFHKRNAFSQEREFRVITPDGDFKTANIGDSELYDLEELKQSHPQVIHCSIDIDELIDRIIIAPNCSKDFHDRVKQTAEHYLDCPTIEESSIEQNEPFI